MIEIDGSQGEGGGQVLRTALSMSVLTGRPFIIEKIRAGRSKPGLAPQHLACVRAAQEICAGKITGDELGSQEVSFEPGEIHAGTFEFDVAAEKPSAGSTSLVLQTLLPALLFAVDSSSVTISGGTNVAWSPTFEYLKWVFLPAVQELGQSHLQLSVERPRAGWYPRGGGVITAQLSPLADSQPLRPIRWIERPTDQPVQVISTISEQLPDHIGPRQINGACQVLEDVSLRPSLSASTERILGWPGTAVLVCLRGRAGGSALGKKGKPAEKVGAAAAAQFLNFLDSGAAVDQRLADQLLIYLAIAEGTSEFTTPEITPHLHTNAWVIKQFLPVEIEFGKGPSDAPLVRVHGTKITPQEG